MNSKQVKWIKIGYGGERAVLASPWLIIGVSYERIYRLPIDAPKWNVFVFDRRLPEREHTIEDAKQRAIETARHALKLALEKLEG